MDLFRVKQIQHTTIPWHIWPRCLAVMLIGSGTCIPLPLSAGIEPNKETAVPEKETVPTKRGVRFVVRVMSTDGRGEVTSAMLSKARATIEKRLNPPGRKEITVTPRGTDRLSVEVPGLSEKEIQETSQIIEKVASLEFRLVTPEGTQFTTKDDTTVKPGFVKMRFLDDPDDEPNEKNGKKEKWVWVKERAEITGRIVALAMPGRDEGATMYKICVTLLEPYGQRMRALSRENLSKPLAIVLDGEVFSAPVINGEFGARFDITGRFSEKQARELSSQLMNPLENLLKVEETALIPPPATPRKQ